MPGITKGFARRAVPGRVGLLVFALLLGRSGPLWGQAAATQAADMLLAAAQKSYTDKNYPQAIAQFRDFLTKYATHKNILAARYGLALALLDNSPKDYAAAAEQLRVVTAKEDFPDRAFAVYYLARTERGLGIKELELAKPADLAQRQAAADKRFAEAAKLFGTAGKAFTAKEKAPDLTAKELPTPWEWSARARCDEAEMLLRRKEAKDACKVAAPFLKDKVLVKSRYRGLGLYYHGFACFLLKDYNEAGRSLNMLTPFTDSVYATHARYLLARTHHLLDELAEAGEHYEGVVSDYAKFKQAATVSLQQPAKFANDPGEKARLEALVRDPPPDHVARAVFYSGVLQYAGGNFSEALTRFASIPQQYPKSTLLTAAQLRQGFCQVQLRQYAEALNTLKPLVTKEPRLADRPLLWIGRAQVGAADPNNATNYAQALKSAMESFKDAVDKAGQQSKSDPDVRQRRGECLLELADTQQLAKQFKDAAAGYAKLLEEKLLPEREQELLQRQITAHHLAGEYGTSDELCSEFRKKFPKSPLLASVLFRHAENAYFLALAAEKKADDPDRARTAAKWTEEAAKRYEFVIEKFPEFTYVNQARYTRGLLYYRKGEFEKAQKTLEVIPQPDRNGDLALASYILADCILRQAPVKADDALAAGKLQEQLQAAIELLDGFTGANATAPQTPDALLKLGLCHMRLAALLAKPEEKTKALTAARTTYENLINKFPKDPLQPQAVFERAKCLSLSGDKNGATNEFRRFTNDPLKTAAIAPLGQLQLAILLREQNKAAEAAKVLDDCRKEYEKTLKSDKQRSGWVVLLQFQQGVALKEAGQFAAARDVFDEVIKQYPDQPEAAEATLRRGQSLKEEALAQVEAARKKLAVPNVKPEEADAAREKLATGLKTIGKAADYLVAQADQLKEKEAAAEVRARMFYEAAWGYRTVGDSEIADARARLQERLLKKAQPRGKKQPAAVPAAPEVALADIKVQPSEAKARAQYQALIEAFPDLPLATDARLELAELFAGRDDHDAAIKLLEEAIDKEPPAELLEKIRLVLGTCYAAKKDYKGALAQFDAVAQNAKSPHLAQAHYRAGEALLGMKDYAKAAARLAVFRDQQPFQNVAGLTDRALLRLGHAYAGLNQWDQSRQAHEQVVARFGNSPWVHEARYGIGFALQSKKPPDYDNAVNSFTQVTGATATETAARAQFQIGQCRLEQKRYDEAAAAFLVVPFTYDYPEWSAAALCEAGRCYGEAKKIAQAEKWLRRVIKEYPKSKWAERAQKQLDALSKS
jgi:TolA-binding protein